MKNMAFSMTTAQMRNKTKTVTRRIGWKNLRAGDVVMAVEKGQGLKKGEKVKKIHPIRILSTRIEPLNKITQDECVREGFPLLTPSQFVEMFIRQGIDRAHPVNRIEFSHV
jgi:hypothetical protein